MWLVIGSFIGTRLLWTYKGTTLIFSECIVYVIQFQALEDAQVPIPSIWYLFVMIKICNFKFWPNVWCDIYFTSLHVMWNTEWMAIQWWKGTIIFMKSDCQDLQGVYLLLSSWDGSRPLCLTPSTTLPSVDACARSGRLKVILSLLHYSESKRV